jgi:hypothetical protein
VRWGRAEARSTCQWKSLWLYQTLRHPWVRFQSIPRMTVPNDSDGQLSRYSGIAKKKIDADFSGGIRSGVNGTPTFFLNGERYDGQRDYDSLVVKMEQVLISNGD